MNGGLLDGQRQSDIDFHSFRRWFVRKVAAALEEDATGNGVWMIAEVVDHAAANVSLEGIKLPLGLTVSRYAGDATEEAKRACVAGAQVADPRGGSLFCFR